MLIRLASRACVRVCAGTVDVVQANLKPHPYDPLRFDVLLKDHAYYLRAVSTEERSEWMHALQETQVCLL